MQKQIFIILLLSIPLGYADNPPVIDYDPSVNFTQYKTFAFISDHPLLREEGSTGGSPLLEGRLMRVTENILAARRFTRIEDREKADIAVAFTVGNREKIQVNSYPAPYRPYYGGWGHRGWGAGYYGGTTTAHQYTEGTLQIDIYDVSEHKPIWLGQSSKRITQKMRENAQDTIDLIVANILSTFPPI